MKFNLFQIKKIFFVKTGLSVQSLKSLLELSLPFLSQTQLSDFTFIFHFHALKKEMATHSSVLAWRIPGMGEPGGLLSMGSHRVGHN